MRKTPFVTYRLLSNLLKIHYSDLFCQLVTPVSKAFVQAFEQSQRQSNAMLMYYTHFFSTEINFLNSAYRIKIKEAYNFKLFNRIFHRHIILCTVVWLFFYYQLQREIENIVDRFAIKKRTQEQHSFRNQNMNLCCNNYTFKHT